MADFPKGVDLSKEEIAIFICSTQGDGVPPYEARAFCEWLFDGASVGDLSALRFSVCALGDKCTVLIGCLIELTMPDRVASGPTRISVDAENRSERHCSGKGLKKRHALWQLTERTGR